MGHLKKHIGRFLFFIAAIALCSLSGAAYAQGWPAGVCTTDVQYAIHTPAPGSGMVSQITYNIYTALMGWTQSTFMSATGYVAPIISGAVSLYIVIYGIFFALGLVPINIADFAVRVVKLSIVAAFAFASSWALFNTMVVQFFNDGVDYFIGAINAIAVGMAPGLYSSAPFAPIDNAVTLLLSARMVVTLIGFAFTGPYGLVYTFLILVGIVLFARCVLEALWTYMLSLLVRTLLLGLAPVFVPTILFSRTRHIFDGWLNQILNTCFQPIFLFMFFGFFSKIVEASVWRILSIPICWTPLELYSGSPLSSHFWRPAIMEGGRWVLYGGDWTLTGPMGGGGMIFPLNIIEVGIFMIVAMLALRFNTLAVNAAKEIAGASTSLNVIGQLPNLMSQINSVLSSPTTRKVAAAGAAGAAVGGLAAIARNLTSTLPGFQRRPITAMATGATPSPDGAPSSVVDGSRTQADGSVAKADGTVVRPDATVQRPDGTTEMTDGSVKQVDGSILRTDGSVLRTDGSIVRADGNILNPDGSLVNMRGEVLDPNTNKPFIAEGYRETQMPSAMAFSQVGTKLGWVDKTLTETFLADNKSTLSEADLARLDGASGELKGAMALLKGGDVDARLQALDKMRKAKDEIDQAAQSQNLTANRIGPQDANLPGYNLSSASAALAGGIRDLENLEERQENKDTTIAVSTTKKPEVMPGLEEVSYRDPDKLNKKFNELATSSGREDRLAKDAERIAKMDTKSLERELRREMREGERAERSMQRKLATLERDMQRTEGKIQEQIREGMPTRFGEQAAPSFDSELVKDFQRNERRLEKTLDSKELKKYMDERAERAARIEAIKDRLGLSPTMEEMVASHKAKAADLLAKEKAAEEKKQKLREKTEAKEKKNDKNDNGDTKEDKAFGSIHRDFAAAIISNLRGERHLSKEEQKDLGRLNERDRGERQARVESATSNKTKAQEKYEEAVSRIRSETQRGLHPETLKSAQKKYDDSRKALDVVSRNKQDTSQALKEVAAARAELKKAQEAADPRKAMTKMQRELEEAGKVFQREESIERRTFEAKEPLPIEDDPMEAQRIELSEELLEQRAAQRRLAAGMDDLDDIMREVSKAESPVANLRERFINFFAGASETLEVTENAAGNSETLSNNEKTTAALDDYSEALNHMMQMFGSEASIVDEKRSWIVAQQRMQESMARMQDSMKQLDQQLKAAMKAMHDQMEELAKAQHNTKKPEEKKNDDDK